MAEGAALTYKRDTLLASLQEQLAASEKKRQDALDAQAKKNQAVIDQLTKLMVDVPQFLVWLAERASSTGWGRPGDTDYPDKVALYYNRDDYYIGNDPDGSIKRLIRVYEKAEDETVEVSVSDEVYRYL